MKINILSNFVLGKNHLGYAVFAGKNFNKNEVLCQFEGEIVPKRDTPKRLAHEEDRYVQVGTNEFMGPSGLVDDYINHSCDPNSGLRFSETGILLVAIKNIQIGDEITWDYSTTLYDNPWKMRCDCRTRKCRKIISDFTLLDPKIQKKYRDLDIIPPYLKEYMDSEEYLVYTKGIQSLKKHAKK